MATKPPEFESELAMQEFWNNMDISGCFYSEDNIPLTVRSRGCPNRESGPDFKNAAVRLGDEKLKGDIELHLRASDWFAHQHQHDRAYSNVILHVVGKNDLDQAQRELLPPMLVLKPDKRRKTGILKGKCSHELYAMGPKKARQLFLKAGAHRFREKTECFTRQIIIEGKEQSFWRFLFEAAGYKRNSPAFRLLFKRFLTYPKELRKKHFEDILWGESGLLPDLAGNNIHPEMKNFAVERWNNWGRICSHASTPIIWKSGGRPANSPERRLAALVNWMRQFGNAPLKELGKYAEIFSPDELVKHVIGKLEVSDPLWDKFVNFNTAKNSPAKISGRSFVLEVAVNVVFPAVYAMTRFEIFDDPEFVIGQIEKAWQLLPATQENAITGRAGELWFKDAKQKHKVLNSAAARQGVLHVYREYCEKCQSDCNSCKWL
ncbi:MAG: DUF2851 family protein [Victivallaceae bacterium]|nr:DUF2851 family protein [Victivallaceae bacterium]